MVGPTPRLPSGGGRTAGAFLGLLNQPSSDGETGNATSRNSFLRLFKIDGIADEPAGFPSRFKIPANARYKFCGLLEGAGG